MTCLKKKSTLQVFKKIALLLSFICINSSLFGAELLTGDKDAAAGQTFSFPIGKYAINSSGNYFYATAKENGAKEFALSRVARTQTAFSSLAPQKVTILGQKDQVNPLYNKGIKYFTLLENKNRDEVISYPVLVTNDKPTDVYIVSLSKQLSVSVFDDIVDNNLDSISSIDAITAASQGNIFAAVAPDGGVFGDIDSAIAVLRFVNFVDDTKKPQEQDDNSDKKIKDDLEALEKGIGIQENIKKTEKDSKKYFYIKRFPDKFKKQEDELEEKKDNKNKSQTKSWVGTKQYNASLDRTSAVAIINGNLASMDVADMYWDEGLKCLFIALQVESGTGADGCKALVIGKVDANGILSLQNIAPDVVFTGLDKIVGATGAGSKVSLHKVRTMFSSNRLSYVVVLGGNGDVASTKKQVYALPLVKDPTEQANCTLANKDALPEDLFAGTIIKRMAARYLKDPADIPAEVLTNTSVEAQVGGGPLDYDISDIFVVGDAIFAVVEPQVGIGQGALYMSRALFDQNGKVKRWTKWQLVSSSTAPMYGAALDAKFGNFVLLSGDAQDNVKTVKRTLWSLGDQNGVEDLSVVMNQLFPKDIAGIQGLFEFPYSSDGAPKGLENITLMVATGYKKVVLAELAYFDSGTSTLITNTGDFSTGALSFADGKIGTIAGDSKVISISGGALNTIGPIEASTITLQSTGASSVNNRLFVGGIGGLAVLVDSTTGDGWITGLGPNFVGLTDTMEFKLVNNFGFVKKLTQLGNYLFILTDDAFYRADLNSVSNDFANGVLDAVKIADFSNVPGMSNYSTFSDFIVSGKLGLLATSYGLFRVGNGKDIAVNTGLNWTEVVVPSYCGPVKQLIALSGSLREQDVADENLNGVLYVLSSYYGKDVSQFNRFTVNYDAGQVDENTILPFPDYFVANPQTGVGSYSYFVNYGMFRDLLEDEGAMRYSSADRDICISPFLRLLIPGLASGQVLPIAVSQTLSLGIENDSNLVRILRSSTGRLFVAGDFGLKVNE